MTALKSSMPQTLSKREYDPEIKDMANYIHNTPIESELAFDTARWVFVDTLGCGLEGLQFEQCRKILGPTVEGTTVPNGCKVPGTNYQLDPINGAFNIGAMIRWLDFNDCWLAAEWGHPSDNLGAILATADWITRTNKAGGNLGNGKIFKVRDVLEAMIRAHEIQGCMALENSFNKVGLDHVILVKLASTAVVSKMMGLSEAQTRDAISQAFVDGQSMRTYRHSPNTMSRKSWAAGDACQTAVNLVLKVMKGEQGLPTFSQLLPGASTTSTLAASLSSSREATAATSWRTFSSRSLIRLSSTPRPPSKLRNASTRSWRQWARAPKTSRVS